MKRILLACLATIGCFPLSAQEHTIKFATLAPPGTAWMNVMREFDAAVRKESGGRLGFKMYASGVQGDEKDVLRKIRLGQLHAAGITGVGIGEISARLRILDAPFLFKTYEEVDLAHTKFEQEFAHAFEQGGYVLVGWAEVGFVYVFSNVPVSRRDDLKRVKMWSWEGDPVAEATFKALGVSPIPLSITDVLTSLQTGLINGVYTTPLAAIALQWWTRVKYMLEYPLANASGAVVISKKYFDTLPGDLKEMLLRTGRTYMEKLTAASRADNAKSIETLKQRGVMITRPDPSVVAQEYEEVGAKARRLLVGRLYPEDLLNRIERAVMDSRTGKTGQ